MRGCRMNKEQEFIKEIEALAKKYEVDTLMIGFSSQRRTHTAGYITDQEKDNAVLQNQILNIYANLLGRFRSEYADRPLAIKSVEESAESVKKDYEKWANLKINKALH